MLVYDITNAKSFDNIAKWLRNIGELKVLKRLDLTISNQTSTPTKTLREWSWATRQTWRTRGWWVAKYSVSFFIFAQRVKYIMSSLSTLDIAHSNYAFQVSKERGEGIAREHNISFLETSAKVMPTLTSTFWDQVRNSMFTVSLQTNINIEKAFLELAEAILDKSNVQETKPVSVPLNQPAQRGGCPGCSQ